MPARGFGSMPLGNVWSFPSKTLAYETTLDAMKNLARAALLLVSLVVVASVAVYCLK